MKTIAIILSGFLIGLGLNAQVITGNLNHQLIGIGTYTVDLDSDSQDDFIFDIIQLGPGLGLAARVDAIGDATILDNSTFGYPDALDPGDPVTGYFHSGIGVLGTFNTAGQFKGMGNKFLGIQLHTSGSTQFGWIYLRCSNLNDTITLISFGYQSTGGTGIHAGEGMSVGMDPLGALTRAPIFPVPAIDHVFFQGFETGTYRIINSMGQTVASGCASEGLNRLDISSLPSGTYILTCNGTSGRFMIP